MAQLRRFQSTLQLNAPSFDAPIPDFDDCPIQQSQLSSTWSASGTPHEPLPVIPHQGTVPFITGETMGRLLSGDYGNTFDEIFVVDCRFAYEFSGGRIAGAVNITDPVLLKEKFFTTIFPRVAIVFHCEFSQCRGPEMASFFRRIDRRMNEDSYPKLHYPHAYVLQRGFSEFARTHPRQIEGAYVRMLDANARVSGALVAANAAFKSNFARANEELQIGDGSAESSLVDANALSPKPLKRRRMTAA
jgi:M-phase inducer tyrosine phosphatase